MLSEIPWVEVSTVIPNNVKIINIVLIIILMYLIIFKIFPSVHKLKIISFTKIIITKYIFFYYNFNYIFDIIFTGEDYEKIYN